MGAVEVAVVVYDGVQLLDVAGPVEVFDGARRALGGSYRLLDGRRATTHWAYCSALAETYPAVSVEPDAIFVRDGRVVTAAGVTAGVDLALSLVEEDHGAELARQVARWLVVFPAAAGGTVPVQHVVAGPPDRR